MTDQELKDLVAQNAVSIAKLGERIEDMRKSQEETNRQMKERDERFDRKMEEMREDWNKELKATVKLRKKLGLIQGDIAEDSIRRSVERNLSQYNIDIHDIILNKEIKDKKTQKPLGEYDIIAVNDTEVVVVEVKNKVTQEHLNHFLNVQLPRFKKLLPEYKDYKLLGGMGGLVIKPEMEKLIESKGLFAFTQNGDSFTVHNNRDFVPKVYG